MKYVAWVFGGLFLLALALGVLQQIAAERVEVIEIHAKEANGEVVTTRLWVVDYKDGMYLRVGADGSGWFSRIQANPTIEVTRGEVTGSYVAEPRPELSDAINELMQEKYTWGDTFIGALVGSRENSIPILLSPSA